MQDKTEKSIVSLKEAIITGLVLDVLLMAMASLILDFGMIFSIALSIGAGHWVGNGLILIFNGSKQSKRDRDFIRFGFLILMPVTVLIVAVFFCCH